MLAFIDESGDPGINRGTRYLIFAMCIFATGDDARHTRNVIREFRQAGNYNTEFKFSNASNDLRDAFFGAVMPRKFQIKAVMMNMHAPFFGQPGNTFLTPEILYQVSLSRLLDNANLHDSRIIIDRRHGTSLDSYLDAQMTIQNENKPGSVREIVSRDSETNDLLQLADMIAGAIARSFYPETRDNHDRWIKRLHLANDDIDHWLGM